MEARAQRVKVILPPHPVARCFFEQVLRRETPLLRATDPQALWLMHHVENCPNCRGENGVE